MKYAILSILIILLLSSYAFNKKNNAQKPVLKNGIKITENTGIKIKEAALYLKDYTPLLESNTVKLNELVILDIELEPDNWTQKDSIVSIGASEKIVTTKGATVLNSEDLFANFKNIKASDAQYLTLKATITENKNEISDFIVYFTVWDKWGKGKFSGNYKLKISK